MNFKIARAGLHFWEEPALSGKNGSGTVFFGGCALKCAYCQNYEISRGGKGVPVTGEQLVGIMLGLEAEGAHNINLVTPSHYAKALPSVLEKAKARLSVPIIYNSAGYDKVENLKNLEGLIDIYLPDFKYTDAAVSLKYSNAPDYFEVAKQNLAEMRRQQKLDFFDKAGLMQRGVIVRHLILPDHTQDSCKVLDAIAAIDRKFYVSLMAQYFPTAGIESRFPELNRRITQAEYDAAYAHFFKAGLKNGFTQDLSSAVEDYVPAFDLGLVKQRVRKE